MTTKYQNYDADLGHVFVDEFEGTSCALTVQRIPGGEESVDELQIAMQILHRNDEGELEITAGATMVMEPEIAEVFRRACAEFVVFEAE